MGCSKCGVPRIQEEGNSALNAEPDFPATAPDAVVSARGRSFCAECGTQLNAQAATSVSETAQFQQRDVAGERRHLTVLFSDLVGSTEISARLDPEEFRELVGGLSSRRGGSDNRLSAVTWRNILAMA